MTDLDDFADELEDYLEGKTAPKKQKGPVPPSKKDLAKLEKRLNDPDISDDEREKIELKLSHRKRLTKEGIEALSEDLVIDRNDESKDSQKSDDEEPIETTGRSREEKEQEKTVLEAIKRAMHIVDYKTDIQERANVVYERTMRSEGVHSLEESELVNFRSLIEKAISLQEELDEESSLEQSKMKTTTKSKSSKSHKVKPHKVKSDNVGSSLVEVEASFGTYEGSESGSVFKPGVLSRSGYARLYNILTGKLDTRGTGVFVSATKKTSIKKIEIFDSNIRRVTVYDEDGGELGEYLEKKDRYRDYAINNPQWGIRINLSVEKQPDEQPKGEPTVIREYRRSSFTLNGDLNVVDAHIPVDGIVIDMSEVKEYTKLQRGETTINYIYELEIEMPSELISATLSSSAIDTITLTNFLNTVQCIYSIIYKPRLVDVGLYGKYLEDISTLNVRKYGVSRFNELLRLAGGGSSLKSVTMDSSFYNKPVNLKAMNILSAKFNVVSTVKLDGERTFLLILRDTIYTISPPYDILKAGNGSQFYDMTIIDGELLPPQNVGEKDRYFAFDVLVYRGKDVRDLPFTERLQYLIQVDGSGFNCTFTFTVKKFYTEGSFYEIFEQAYTEMAQSDIPTDGIILQSKEQYLNDGTFKYKPENTIDFYLTSHPNPSQLARPLQPLQRGTYYLLCSRGRGNFVPFYGNGKKPMTVTLGDTFDGELLQDRIVEMKWNSRNGTFEVYRIRYGKDYANSLTTAISVWADIIDPLLVDSILGRDLYLLRKYHNSEKRQLLTATFGKGNSILDIGSGRGGDLDKWVEAGIDRVFAVEPSPENIRIMTNRIERSKKAILFDELDATENDYIFPGPKITIIQSPAEKTEQILAVTGDNTQNGVVSFFSLTFLPRKKKTLEAFIETLDKVLAPGGKFIGITMDGGTVRSLLEDERKKQGIKSDEVVEYDNGVFSIRQTSIFDDKYWGNEIVTDIKEKTSMVHDVTEYLVYFSDFEDLLKKKGIKLKATRMLDSGPVFENLPQTSKDFSSLFRLFVFEKKGKKEVKFEEQEGPSGVELGPAVVTGDVRLQDVGLRDISIRNVKDDSSNFFRCILKARGLDDSDKAVKKFRKELADAFTPAIFARLRNGGVKNGMLQRVVAASQAVDVLSLDEKLEKIDEQIALLSSKAKSGASKAQKIPKQVQALKQSQKRLEKAIKKRAKLIANNEEEVESLKEKLKDVKSEKKQIELKEKDGNVKKSDLPRYKKILNKEKNYKQKLSSFNRAIDEQAEDTRQLDVVNSQLSHLEDTEVPKASKKELKRLYAERKEILKMDLERANKKSAALKSSLRVRKRIGAINAELSALGAPGSAKKNLTKIRMLQAEKMNLIESIKKTTEEEAFQEYKMYIADPEIWMDKSIVYHIAKHCKLDIYILDNQYNLSYFPDTPPGKYPNSSIVLYTPDGDLYFPVAEVGKKKNKFIFEKDGEVMRNISSITSGDEKTEKKRTKRNVASSIGGDDGDDGEGDGDDNGEAELELEDDGDES